MTTTTISALNAPRNRRAAAQQRARRRLRTFRRVCGCLAFLNFFFLLGVVGGVEHDTIDLLPGTLYMFGDLAFLCLNAWLAGAFK